MVTAINITHLMLYDAGRQRDEIRMFVVMDNLWNEYLSLSDSGRGAG